jgi:hypothetical protein
MKGNILEADLDWVDNSVRKMGPLRISNTLPSRRVYDNAGSDK